MALLFPGSADKLTTPTFVVPTAVTYATWVKDVDGVTSTGPRIFENTTPTTRWFIDTATSEFVFQRLYGNTGEWRAPWPAGINWALWHHLAVTHDASLTTNVPVFYCDGVIMSPVTTVVTPTGSVNTTTNIMNIGNRPTSARPVGRLEYTGIYSAVLSQANVQSLLTTAHFASSRFANWTYDPDGATFTDISGNSRTATKSGAPTYFTPGPSLSADQIISNTNFAVSALPRVIIPLGANIAVGLTAALEVASGTPYIGGPGAGIGGPARGRYAVLRRRRR